jgi:hypothetical protein
MRYHCATLAGAINVAVFSTLVKRYMGPSTVVAEEPVKWVQSIFQRLTLDLDGYRRFSPWPASAH